MPGAGIAAMCGRVAERTVAVMSAQRDKGAQQQRMYRELRDRVTRQQLQREQALERRVQEQQERRRRSFRHPSR